MTCSLDVEISLHPCMGSHSIVSCDEAANLIIERLGESFTTHLSRAMAGSDRRGEASLSLGPREQGEIVHACQPCGARGLEDGGSIVVGVEQRKWGRRECYRCTADCRILFSLQVGSEFEDI